MIALAQDEGFSGAAVVDTKDIPFDSTFRQYCAENLCGKYGVNYSCPPACGSPEEMRQKILKHKKALVLQTIWEISDYTDKDLIAKSKKSHNMATIRLVKQFREENIPGLIVGVSGCSLCSPCAIMNNEPCKFPDLRFSCMSAYCIFVRKLAESCGLEYTLEPGLLAFFGMYVFD